MHRSTNEAASEGERMDTSPRADSPFLRLCVEIPELVRAISHHLTEEEDLVSLALACRSARDALRPYGAASNLPLLAGRGSLLVVRAIGHPWFEGITVMQRHGGPDGRLSFRRWRKRVPNRRGAIPMSGGVERRIRPDGADALARPREFSADMYLCYLLLMVLTGDGVEAEVWRDGCPLAGSACDALWAAFGPSPTPPDARLRQGFYGTSGPYDVPVASYADAFAHMGGWSRGVLRAIAARASESGPEWCIRVDFRVKGSTFPTIEYVVLF